MKTNVWYVGGVEVEEKGEDPELELIEALELIANGDQRPGHVNYLSKKQMADIARRTLDARKLAT